MEIINFCLICNLSVKGVHRSNDFGACIVLLFVDYAHDMMEDLLTRYAEDRKGLMTCIEDQVAAVPPTLADGMERVGKDAAIANYIGRFNR